MYTPHTITIFNEYKDTEASNKLSLYQATRIDGVFKQGNRAQAADGYGMKKTGTAKIFIPFTATIEDGRVFIPAEKFVKLSADERAGYWTINEKHDFFIVGTYTQTDVTIRYEDIRTAHGSAHKVLTVNCCDYGSADMRHWEVEGE